MPRPLGDPVARFESQVIPEPNTGCHLWTGPINPTGYGSFPVKTGPVWETGLAHRFAYQAYVGPIPSGLMLDHICRVRCCVNPEHLRPVTCRENLLCGDTHAARNFKKTHCHRGHEFNGVNNKVKVDPTGKRKSRACMVCENINQRARRAAR